MEHLYNTNFEKLGLHIFLVTIIKSCTLPNIKSRQAVSVYNTLPYGYMIKDI